MITDIEIANVFTYNCTFFDNSASEGGVVYFDSVNFMDIGSMYYGNEARNEVTGYSFNITIVNCSFKSNIALREGGILHTISHSVITDSKVASMFTYNCTFFNNSANEGGVAYLRSITFMDVGSEYTGNKARNGGVFTLNDGIIKASTSRFVNNTAIESGGVLYTPSYDYEHVFNLENCFFINNSANSGGAIAVLYNASVTVITSTFIQNNAIRGGAIYLLINYHLLASYSNFSHNLAKSNDGTIKFSQKIIICCDLKVPN